MYRYTQSAHCAIIPVHPCTGDLIVSYRTDANRIAIGSGFHIYVYKDLGTVHDCSQAQDIDFDVKTMPHIKGCPSLTHDQLVARVVRFSDELIKNKTQTPSKDPLLRAHLFTPPHMQCVSPVMFPRTYLHTCTQYRYYHVVLGKQGSRKVICHQPTTSIHTAHSNCSGKQAFLCIHHCNTDQQACLQT